MIITILVFLFAFTLGLVIGLRKRFAESIFGIVIEVCGQWLTAADVRIKATDAKITAAGSVLVAHCAPDGISDGEAVNRFYEIFDDVRKTMSKGT